LNPVLGEYVQLSLFPVESIFTDFSVSSACREFFGVWPDVGFGETTLSVEQVSHHPPIVSPSAFFLSVLF
jgi:hypothetical protein